MDHERDLPAEQSQTRASGNTAGGHPASGAGWDVTAGRHEVFHQAYSGESPAPWDIGRPQPAMQDAVDRGWVRGRVLDVGCGTGENALYFAEQGMTVLGVDVVPTAIDKARKKAQERGVAVVFFLGDLTAPGPVALSEERFDTVTDVGFFHALSDEHRGVWTRRLAALLAPGGSYVMLCFSDRVPGAFGPRRISEAELRATFMPKAGFSSLAVEPAALEAAVGPGHVDAWLVRAVRAAD